jgi:ribosomal protein S28E/S33
MPKITSILEVLNTIGLTGKSTPLKKYLLRGRNKKLA